MTRDVDEIHLAETLGNVARELLSQHGLEDTLDHIATLAVATIPGCDHAAISLVQGRVIRTRGANDEVGPLVDAIQYAAGQGPCLDAIREQQMVMVEDLSSEPRWPNFAGRAARETGVRSMLAFRLFAEAETFGALNLYSRACEAFDEHAQDIGAVFAVHAAVALLGARHDEQFAEALASRDIIGQAKGIIMATRHISSDAAFTALVGASQDLNLKLRDVAKRVTDAGELRSD